MWARNPKGQWLIEWAKCVYLGLHWEPLCFSFGANWRVNKSISRHPHMLLGHWQLFLPVPLCVGPLFACSHSLFTAFSPNLGFFKTAKRRFHDRHLKKLFPCFRVMPDFRQSRESWCLVCENSVLKHATWRLDGLSRPSFCQWLCFYSKLDDVWMWQKFRKLELKTLEMATLSDAALKSVCPFRNVFHFTSLYLFAHLYAAKTYFGGFCFQKH